MTVKQSIKIGTTIEELARHALEVAKLGSDHDSTWCREFARYVNRLKRARLDPSRSPAEIREAFQRVSAALVAATRAVKDLPPGYWRPPLLAELEIATRHAKWVLGNLHVSLSGGRHDPDLHIKKLAAEYVFELLTKHGRTPTQSNDGSYYSVASLLFEAATGRRHVSIAHQCRYFAGFAKRFPEVIRIELL
jgi:hypothetical protein